VAVAVDDEHVRHAQIFPRYRATVKAPERADVVIVGAGLLGLATAYALRGRREVLVLERETVGHERGGSRGPTRIFRLGYLDPADVRMAMAARNEWTALESETDTQLLHPKPQLSFGPGAPAVRAALIAAGAPVEDLDAAAVDRGFPAFAGRGPAVLDSSAAVIAADRTLETLAAHASAEIRTGARVQSVDDGRVVLDDRIIEAHTVVVCAGPWSRALVAGLATTMTLEHVGYARVREDLPIFIDFDTPTVYGLPTPGTDLYKIAVHHGGRVIDPEEAFTVDAAAVEALHAAAERWLPGRELVDIDVCPYDNTVDQAFVVSVIDGIVVGAGTSGHGFKFGPLLGARLAALVESLSS
jgi:sarcosine oxidase